MQKDRSFSLVKVVDRLRKYFSIKEKFRQQLRARWGQVFHTYRSRKQTPALFLLTKKDTTEFVDDAAWNDLDIDSLFNRLDNTITPIGRQFLYRQLRCYEFNEQVLADRYQLANFFKISRDVREETQLALMGLRSTNVALVTPMLFGGMPDGRFPRVLAMVMAAFSVVTLAIAFVAPVLFWLPAIPLIANFVFSETFAPRIGRHSVSFGYLKKLLFVASNLAAVDQKELVEPLDYLRRNRVKIRKYYAAFIAGGLDSTDGNPVVAQLAFLLNLIFLFDFLVFMHCEKYLLKNRSALQEIYTAVASVDAAISVGSYLSLTGDHCNPRFNAGNHFQFDNVTHPLLEIGVPNDFESDDNSALITGSNMAGKSTFIKTVGINLVLGQTLWLCHARAASIPKILVLSSIKHTDSLEEGKSYYFAEIDALLRLIKASDSGKPHLFLIDEILHGTNTIERIASSAAILKYLSEKNTVLVTTHDVELSQLLNDKFQSYHFRETTDPNKLFDYKIHAGNCSTRNAITLLESVGFPAVVTDAARRLATELET